MMTRPLVLALALLPALLLVLLVLLVLVLVPKRHRFNKVSGPQIHSHIY
jgi:hypothetical protein